MSNYESKINVIMSSTVVDERKNNKHRRGTVTRDNGNCEHERNSSMSRRGNSKMSMREQ
jgi:hypothetical protein